MGGGILEGELHPRARLTDEKVREMRRRVAAGATSQTVADWAGCAWTTAYKAVTGLSWRSIDNPPPIQTRRHCWSGDEIQYLAEHVDDHAADVAAVLGRSANAIDIKRFRQEL